MSLIILSYPKVSRFYNITPYETEEGLLHDVVIKRSGYNGKIKIENVPPSEFLISREAKNIQDARFVCQRVQKNSFRIERDVSR